ncbi:MAG: response regulator [Candidatus Sericytochromatia bacterium]|nr:response regulator [Candidatus Sericytochromatia bacterium]
MRNNRLKLLVVGNNQDNLETLKSLIDETLPELHLINALSGEEGLDQAWIEAPDVILLDMAQPEMESYEICRKLKADQRLKSIPVVFLTTTETDQTSLAKAADLGADAFLRLPLDAISLKIQMNAMARLKIANLAEGTTGANNDFLVDIIESLGQPVFVKDHQHRFLFVNAAFCDLFGLNRNQIIGKTLTEEVSPDEREFFLNIDNEVLLNGRKSVVEESLTLRGYLQGLFLTTKTRYINKNGEKFLIGVIQDITERKAIENELHRSSLLLENSQAIAKVGGWELDFTTNQLFWTAETYRIFDTSPDEFNPTADVSFNYFLPESRRIFSAVLQAAIEHGEGFDLNLEVLTAKNRRIDVRMTCVVTFEQGRPAKLTGSFQDITQQKRAEAELHSKDIQFRKLSDNIPDMIYQFTRRPDGTYCVPIASKGIENIFGCTPEDVKADFAAIAKVLHPEDSARVIHEIEASAKHLSDFMCEFRVHIPGREIQWILSRSKPEKLPDGSITWFGFNVDITKQKLIEQKLQEYQQKLEQVIDVKTDELQTSERHFRHLVEGVKQDYFFFTIGPEGVLTYLSPSAETFFGQSMDTLLGKSGNELLHLENVGPLYQHAFKGMNIDDQNPPPFEIDLTLREKKQYLEISEHITRNEMNTVIAEEGVIKDITRQKRVEQDLREAIESAKIASQAKSMFLANMSHEIRTPMNAILGFSELMQEQSKEPRFQKYLEAINSSGKALLRIINEILDIAKIESGKLTLNPEPVNLCHIIDEIKVLLERSFVQKGLHFHVETSAELPAYLELDALRLRQVLLNLLGNALKFTFEGEVSLKLDFVPQNADGGCLTLTVQDTGVGISEENQKRIFKAFEQVIDPMHPFSSGTGLGLAITQSLVDLMGGKLQMRSIVGQGTCFTVVLPEVQLAAFVAAEPIQAPMDLSLFQAAQVLIADDVPDNLLLLESLLESSPLKLMVAHNGREACEIAQTMHPDLILMDIKMPEMDGVQALQQLKSQAETQSIPVVALTAYSLKQDQESLLKKGFDAFLSKPVQKSDLLRCLKNFLPSRERASETTPTDSVFSEVPLTVEAKTQLQKRLYEQWLPRWETIKDSIVINDLESFATELQELAKAYQSVELQKFTQRLLMQIGQFAFERSQETLSHFPDLVASIFVDQVPV